MAAAALRGWSGGEVTDMAVEGIQYIPVLGNHHLDGMDRPLQRALVLRCDGKSDAEVGEIEGVSAGTIKTRVMVASSEIGMCLAEGTRLTGEMRGVWVGAHRSCCLKEVLAELRGTG